jgi:hypothetical protein
MKHVGSVLLIVCGGMFPSIVSAQSGADNKGFTLVKEKDHIRIYERWIHFPKVTPPVEAREVKSVFSARATLSDALALLRDESRIQQWQSHVAKFKVYPKNDSLWYEYSYHDIPWPVSDQDHFLVYRIEKQIPGQEIFVTFESIVNDKLAPVNEDADRMTLAGSWTFLAKKDSVEITYRILSMPSSIPRIFTDPVIRNNMLSTAKAYVDILDEKRKR